MRGTESALWYLFGAAFAGGSFTITIYCIHTAQRLPADGILIYLYTVASATHILGELNPPSLYLTLPPGWSAARIYRPGNFWANTGERKLKTGDEAYDFFSCAQYIKQYHKYCYCNTVRRYDDNNI